MSKSILEKALLEAEQLEETMKSNAKEILSSTMKKEIHELVKESLDNENDYLKEQEEEEEVEIDVEDEMEMEPEMEPEIELAIDDEGLSIEDETEDDDMSLELPPLDLTLASDSEVLKVFKAMGDEDGIIIQKDDNEIEITDNNTDTEYLIKLDESETEPEGDDATEAPVEEVTEMEDEEEFVYEIELGEDYEEEDHKDRSEFDGRDSKVIGVDSDIDKQRVGEDEEIEEHQDFADRRHERQGMRKHYGKTPDALHRLSGAEQGYDDREDESLAMLHGEADDVEGEVKEGGAKKDDQSKSRSDYKGYKGTDKGYKGKTGSSHGDQGEPDDYSEGEIEETSRLKAGPNSSFSRMAGQKKSWGSQKESRRPRKANLGESRIRKSYNLLKEEVESMKVKNAEYKKALVTFRDKLNEVGVFNSNLAYVTRLFTEHSTTKLEKINILKRFDSVDSLKSSKSLYKVIKEELTKHVAKPTKTIAESVEKKITKSPTSGGKLLETKIYENPQFSRMKDLMSKL